MKRGQEESWESSQEALAVVQAREPRPGWGRWGCAGHNSSRSQCLAQAGANSKQQSHSKTIQERPLKGRGVGEPQEWGRG